jgi:hypothetical protein
MHVAARRRATTAKRGMAICRYSVMPIPVNHRRGVTLTEV